MKIATACDHAGFEYKEQLVRFLRSEGHEVKDFGTYSTVSMDYPDTVHPLAISIEAGTVEMGIVLCGAGNGVAMTANKHQGVRCALCWQPGIAETARKHNDANVCAIPARLIAYQETEKIVETFLKTAFDGGRHEKRVSKIPIFSLASDLC
ncbi:ribose 5-phosphate isomerase B [Bacteroidia bacterium]|nr:ribose 5-phosphate isomerase B [Bacteroidia bacterium]